MFDEDLLLEVASFAVVLISVLFLVFNLFGQDRSSLRRLPRPRPAQMAMNRVRLPFVVRLDDEESSSKRVRCVFKDIDENVGVRLRLYADVSVAVYHHVLRAPFEWFKTAVEEGNVFGSDGGRVCGHGLDFLDEDGVYDVTIDHDDGVASESPRTRYPFVLIALIDDKAQSDVGGVLSVIHVKDSALCPLSTRILYTHLKHMDGRSTLLSAVFVDEDEDEERNCAVCRDARITRVLFPCRHACLCKKCYKRLRDDRCPMCRTRIDSFFLLHEEDDEDDEEEEAPKKATWGEWFADWSHRYAMAAGLQQRH